MEIIILEQFLIPIIMLFLLMYNPVIWKERIWAVAFLLSFSLGIAGSVFKVLHWPGADVLLIAGLLAISCEVALRAILKPAKSLTSVFKTVFGTLFPMGVLFKVLYWPGASILLIVSLLALSSVAVMKFKKQTDRKFTTILRTVFGALFPLGLLFKLQHWPGSSPVLIVALVVLSLSYLIDYVVKHFISFNNIVRGAFGTFFPLAYLFKVMHWPYGETMLMSAYIVGVVLMLLESYNYITGTEIKRRAA